MAVLSDADLLRRSCQTVFDFPKNIIRQSTPKHHLNAYQSRLVELSCNLFCDDGLAALDIWEYDDQVKEFQSTRASSVFELKGRLEGKQLYSHDDPRCRFLFVHAPHSRDRLKISIEMLVTALTHHQAMPSFLDFLFPFGMQEHCRDFFFSGLREETQLLTPARGLVIPELGRSGREIRLCYNLKSVEPSRSNPEWPWSIRQTAVYYSFDVETGKSFWVVIKGNQLIKNRIKAATEQKPNVPPELNMFETNAKAFSATLSTHLILADWCDEEWRWYLNYLEKRLQDATGRALAITYEKAPSIQNEPVHYHSNKALSPSILRTFTSFTKRTFSTSTKATKVTANSDLGKIPFQAPFPYPLPPLSPPQSPLGPPAPPKLPPGFPGATPAEGCTIGESPMDKEDFAFKNLQWVYYFEEKANQIPPVLESNIDILKELKRHYQSIIISSDFPTSIKSNCTSDFEDFVKHIDRIITDLQRQRSRTLILSRLLSDRKDLLSSILNQKAIELSKSLTKRTQESTDRMESVTNSMYEIAEKTQQETVSMKIITLVTLFFLPGTFISTIMSTDIIKFSDNSENFQIRALKLYLEITIPCMFLTFAAWYIMYRWSNRNKSGNKGSTDKDKESLAEKGLGVRMSE